MIKIIDEITMCKMCTAT